MPAYYQINDYFVQKRNESIDKVFQIFLYDASFEYDEETLKTEFAAGYIIPLTGNNVFWVDLLRQKKDKEELPILAYALAGNISEARYTWLLKQLGADAISSQRYDRLSCSIIAITAAFGSVQRLNILLGSQNYVPTEKELIEGLFYATYYGHKKIFNFILKKINKERKQKDESDLVLDALRDNEDNTLLHVAVFGESQKMIQHIAASCSSEFFYSKNAEENNVMEEAILLGNLQLVEQLIQIYDIYEKPFDYDGLAGKLVAEADLSIEQREVFNYLKSKCSNDESKRRTLAQIALDADNMAEAQEIIDELPRLEAISDQSPSKLHIPERQQFENWKGKIFTRLRFCMHEYIYRKNGDLKKLAEDDGLSKSYHSSSTVFDSTKEKRFTVCQTILENFFNQSHIRVIRGLYEALPSDKKNPELFISFIKLKRNELISFVRNTEAPDIENFNKKLLSFLEAAKESLSNQHIEIPRGKIALGSGCDDESIYTSENARYSDTYSVKDEKIRIFIETFAKQFDKMHRFFACISEGDLVRKPDHIDELAVIGKKAANILPDVSVSLAALGLPIPISIDFPSSVAVAAVIDLCMYIRKESQQDKADRIKNFFDTMSPRERINVIYHCAESVAHKFQNQIDVLDSLEGGVPYFAEVMVVRVFDYMVKNENNLTTDQPRLIGTLFRKAVSFLFDVGPEPETIQKSLNTVTHDAISTKEYLVCKKRAEEKPLTLSHYYRNSTETNSNRQWSVRGILENTGIQAEDESLYAGRRQDIEKYGYTLSTKKEADLRGMTRQSFDRKPWFDETETLPRVRTGYSSFSGSSPVFSQNSSRKPSEQQSQRQTVARGFPK